MPGTSGVTPRSKALGEALRQARDRSGLGVRDLARRLGWNHARLSRYETGARAPGPEDVARILTALEVTGNEYEEMLDFVREPDRPQWVGFGMTEQQRQLATLLDYETQASSIVYVSPLLVPGLLQTGGYARAIMRTGSVPDHEIETRVAVRLGRRDILTRRDPVALLAFIGEQALMHDIGGPGVMAEQVDWLAEVATAPNIDLRVLPLRSPWHPGLEGPWLLVEPREGSNLGPVVHLEIRNSGVFLHRHHEVGAYRDSVDKVLSAALTPSESADVIARASERWKRVLHEVEEVQS